MLMVLSPAKKLDFADIGESIAGGNGQEPHFSKQSKELVKVLRDYSLGDLRQLMGVSDKLAQLNFDRYRDFGKGVSKSAILAFSGDVYRGLGAGDFSKKELKFAEKHLRILSGLYGILRPLDGIFPYRLEMGTGLQNSKGGNLYDFWGDSVAGYVNGELSSMGGGVLVNLASVEYFKVIRKDILDYPILNIHFRQERDDRVRTIALLAKVARGMMARYVVKGGIDRVEGMRDFREDGYRFRAGLSDDDNWVFVQKV